jgi:transcriptional regulator with XRE-family HTH domain
MKKATRLSLFGKNLRRFRTAKGLTQAQLAEQVGMSRRMIVHYEKYATHPPAEKIAQLARVLDVSAEDLLKTDSSPQPLLQNDLRFAKKLEKAKQLPPEDKKAIETMITTFLKKAKKP